MTFRPKARSFTTSILGVRTGHGNGGIAFCRASCARAKGVSRLPSRLSWTANRSKRRKRGVSGYDSGKQVKGRKRHLLVDTLGLVMKVLVTKGDRQDRDGAKLLLVMILGLFPRLKKLWADGAYRGALVKWVKQQCRLDLEIVERDPTCKGFVLLPRRWVVERTFAWLSRCRRLSKDYEYYPQTSEAFVYVAMIRLMTRRLARSP